MVHEWRPASAPTSAQPKSIAVAGDATVFVVEIDTIEAFRSNQKVFQQNPSYQPTAVGAKDDLIVIGGEVNEFIYFFTKREHSSEQFLRIEKSGWTHGMVKAWKKSRCLREIKDKYPS